MAFLAWQGFYQELQEHIMGSWGYVSNKKGGFWAFWWNPSVKERYYYQLEQQRFCVKFKMRDGEDQREIQQKQLEKILSDSETYGLLLKKPSRIKNGKTMTIAIRDNYIQLNLDGTVNMEETIKGKRQTIPTF